MNRVAILLAAGKGERFRALVGDDAAHKLLQEVAPNMTVFRAALNNLRASGIEHIIVVTQIDLLDDLRAEARKFLPPNLGLKDSEPSQIIWATVTPNAAQADSLRATLQKAMDNNLSLDGCLIALADMPCVKPSTIQAVLTQAIKANCVRPQFKQQAGHPVWIGANYFDKLLALEGDQGARDLLRQIGVDQIHTDDEGCVLDVDKPADLAEVVQKWAATITNVPT